MNILDAIGHLGVKRILYRQLVLNERLDHIHRDNYSNICSLSGFRSFAARVITYPEYKNFVVENLMSDDKYDFNYGRKTVLSSKKESYWQSEDDIIFHDATYNSLSHEEKLIYSDGYLENFLESRKQME